MGIRRDTGDGSNYALQFDGVSNHIDLGALGYPSKYRDPRIISKSSVTSSNDHVFNLGTIKSGSATVQRAAPD